MAWLLMTKSFGFLCPEKYSKKLEITLTKIRDVAMRQHWTNEGSIDLTRYRYFLRCGGWHVHLFLNRDWNNSSIVQCAESLHRHFSQNSVIFTPIIFAKFHGESFWVMNSLELVNTLVNSLCHFRKEPFQTLQRHGVFEQAMKLLACRITSEEHASVAIANLNLFQGDTFWCWQWQKTPKTLIVRAGCWIISSLFSTNVALAVGRVFFLLQGIYCWSHLIPSLLCVIRSKTGTWSSMQDK